MSDILLEKLNHIEEMLMEINVKIDNFLGFEEMSKEELLEIKKLKQEVSAGKFEKYENIFSD